MTKFIWVILMACLVVGPLSAGADERNRGWIGDFEGPPGAVNVAEVAFLSEGTAVTLVGRIETSYGQTFFRFADPTGDTEISIDYDQQDILNDLSGNDIVEIHGTVSQNFDRIYVTVDQIIKR